MKKLALLALLVVMALSTVSSAGVLREIWWGYLDIDPAIELVQSGEPADQLDILAEPTWVNIADNYVARMSGWLTVPETGEYTFYVSGDDYQRLYISQDDDPANAEMVAFVDGWTASQEWTKYESQAAEPMMLEEGQVMAIYGIMQEGGGGDGQDWGWIVPDSEEITLIPGELFSHPYEELVISGSPASGATGVIEAALSWDPPAVGEDPIYDVYFGTNAAELEPLAEGIVETEVFAGTAGIELDFETTYYWRVDADGTEGLVWSFTTEPMAFAVQNIIATSNGDPSEGSGPEKAIDGVVSTETVDQWLATPPEGEALWIQFEFPRVYKMHDVAIWNSNTGFESMLGYGAKDVTIEYSADGEEWAVFGDVELPQAPGTDDYDDPAIIDLEGIGAKFVRLTINSNWLGLFDDSGLAEVAFTYVPAHARLVAPADGATGVSPATELDWYAGRGAVSSDVIVDGELVATVEDSSLAADLVYGMPYTWQVDEFDGVDVWEGDLWSFSTAEFETIFSDELIYDEEGNALAVDVDGADLTAYAPNTLRLAFRGSPVGFVEEDGVVQIGAAGADIWGTADEFRFVYKSFSGDGEMIVRVDDIENIRNNWAKAGPMIRQDLTAGSANAMVAITGGSGGGASMQWRQTADDSSGSQRLLEGTMEIAPPYYARLVREGNTFTGYVSEDGEEWLLQGSGDVEMEDPVYIGMAVTSHTRDHYSVATMSEISIEGEVEGEWANEVIGAQEMFSNDAAGLYVAIEDAAGQVATMQHPEAAATQLYAGTQVWNIPMKTIEGVDLTDVATLTVGAGTPEAPADGSGMVNVTVSIGTPMSHNVLADVTSANDVVQGVPDDEGTDMATFGWPPAEAPALAIDNDVETKFLHFRGDVEPTGIRVTPAVGATVVTELALTTANDAPERDPVSFEVYGSNDGIDGPYELIAAGDVVDFAGEEAWPRFTKNATPIVFENDVAYTSYQVLFPMVRDPEAANSMQIAEIELIGVASW